MSITVCLLNWERPENLHQIVDMLVQQTHRPQLFLWDNSPEPFRRPEIDWTVHSSRNMGCFPRWQMALEAQTEYVMSLDDDLMPVDLLFIEDLLKAIRAETRAGAVGAFGKQLVNSFSYRDCPEPDDSGWCHILLGRLLATSATSLKQQLREYLFSPTWKHMADDIGVSQMLGNIAGSGGANLKVLNWMRTRLAELPAEHGLCLEEGHYEAREMARRYFFST